MYCRLECLQPEGSRSPIVFIHGFPDSPLMFRAYYSVDERQREWLRDRQIYTIAFPNRFTNPNYPPLGALLKETLQAEIDALLKERIAASPTGQIIPIVHDWGATTTWKFIRHHPDQRAGIEKLVALSVPSTFRYDIWAKGLLAFGWLYSTLFGAPYWLPFGPVRRAVTGLITRSGGYRSDRDDTLYQDTYHYWYGILRPLLLPFDLLGLRIRPAFLDFAFPVLFMRSPQDQLPANPDFERAMQTRQDCRFVLVEGANHWFPEQHAERVLAEIRTFI
ncbi:MAG: alpha/beta fold hydrolase [Candidatus Flexifilum sp.]